MPTSLRGKTILIIFMIVVGLVGGLYLLSRVVLLRGSSNLEEDLARQDMENASSSLSNELVALDHISSEYAAWDHTYAYLRGQNPAYVRSEFSAATLQHLKVGFVVILDESRRKVFSKGCDQVTGKETECPSNLDDHLNRGSSLTTSALVKSFFIFLSSQGFCFFLSGHTSAPAQARPLLDRACSAVDL
jgi:sensor domain CHASE-containing protein